MKSNIGNFLFYINKPKKWISLAIIFISPFFVLTACSQNKIITWREEVKLVNGTIITAECSAEYKNVYDGNSIGWLFQHEKIKAIFPSLNKEIVWSGSIVPLAIDINKNGEIYLVATVQTSQGEIEYPITHGIYVAFKYEKNGLWVRIPIESVPDEFKPNLLIDPVSTFTRLNYSTGQTIELTTKEKLNSDPRFNRDYRSWAPK